MSGNKVMISVQGVMVDASHALAKIKNDKTRAAIENLLIKGLLKDGVLRKDHAIETAKAIPCSMEELCDSLVPIAAMVVYAPVSNFAVGAVALAATGDIVIGSNIEIRGLALALTGHAEQAAVSRAIAIGGGAPKLLTVDTPPCGYCRQLIREAYEASGKKLALRVRGKSTDFEVMLPDAFGPTDLNVDPTTMGKVTARIELPHAAGLTGQHAELAQAAAKAAGSAYTPYGRCHAALAVLNGEHIIIGAYQENAAYNPSISPAEAVLAEMGGRGLCFKSVSQAVLVEGFEDKDANSPMVSHKEVTELLLRALNPAITFTYIKAKAHLL